MRDVGGFLIAMVALVGVRCSSAPASPAGAPPGSVPGGLDGGADAGQCQSLSTSSLAGVTIAFPAGTPCSFTVAQAAAGITIPYEVEVAADVTGVVATPQDAGGCGRAGASGLITLEQLTGGGLSYCLCDTGLCARTAPPPVTLHGGTYAGAFMWDGRSWNGPSDTGNPEGAPFPAGTYALEVSATGTKDGAPFTVTGTLTIELTQY